MNPIFNDFDKLFNNIRILFSKKEYEPLKSEIHIHANIILSDLKRKNSVVIYISKNTQKNYIGFSTSTRLSLIGPSIIWKNILTGEKSLMAAFVEGTIKVPNLRVNWSNLWKLSNMISNLKNLNKFIVKK